MVWQRHHPRLAGRDGSRNNFPGEVGTCGEGTLQPEKRVQVWPGVQGKGAAGTKAQELGRRKADSCLVIKCSASWWMRRAYRDRGRRTEDLAKPVKEFELYPEGKGEPVKGFKGESDRVYLVIWNEASGHCVRFGRRQDKRRSKNKIHSREKRSQWTEAGPRATFPSWYGGRTGRRGGL